MVAPLVLLHPVLALGALFSADALCPGDKLVIFWQLVVVDMVDFALQFGLALFFLDLVTTLLNVIDHFALQAVLDTAGWAKVIRLALLFLEE